MREVVFLAALFVASVFVLTSCGKQEDACRQKSVIEYVVHSQPLTIVVAPYYETCDG